MAAQATTMKRRLRGLYVITEDRPPHTRPLLTGVESALRGGARIVQYRDKSDEAGRRLDEAQALMQLCHRYDALLLINDDVRLAANAGADGVHLGREDADIAAARRQLPADALIGVSCYNEFALARRAAGQGASYIAFGSFHPSPTKPRAVRAQPKLLQRARRELALPTVAIGGISPENGAALVSAGADMLAVISAVFAAPDVEVAARAFTTCFNRAEETNR
jgi:thiamine-phosphate pyrophosphorylase